MFGCFERSVDVFEFGLATLDWNGFGPRQKEPEQGVLPIARPNQIANTPRRGDVENHPVDVTAVVADQECPAGLGKVDATENFDPVKCVDNHPEDGSQQRSWEDPR